VTGAVSIYNRKLMNHLGTMIISIRLTLGLSEKSRMKTVIQEKTLKKHVKKDPPKK
jgi:hypothetical protein